MMWGVGTSRKINLTTNTSVKVDDTERPSTKPLELNKTVLLRAKFFSMDQRHVDKRHEESK